MYFGYRFYVPNLRRWLNRDPLQEQGGINLYPYVEGDPLGYVDPDGRYSVAAGGRVGARVGAIVSGPVGAVVGGVVGVAAGAAICLATDICNFNEESEGVENPDDITRDLTDGIKPDPHDYPKDGGEKQCDEDFDRYPGEEVDTGDPNRRRKQLPDGRWINKHPSRYRPGTPTLDVPKSGTNGRKRTKIRYGD